jgi:guanine deaminase
MRLIAGKVLMDRHAPDNLRDGDVAGAERDCVDLIQAGTASIAWPMR